MSRPVRVAIVDDHPAMQSGLVAVLTAPPDPAMIVAKVSSVEDLDALTGAPQPDVVLLDLDLPRGLSGAAGVAHVAAKHKVVVLTNERDPRRLLAAREAGALACLNKVVDNDTVRGVVAAVARGQDVTGSADAGAALWAAESTPSIELTETQQLVLELLTDGLDNAAIRVRLDIAQKTLEAHLREVYEQLRLAGVLGESYLPGDRERVITAAQANGFVVQRRRRRPHRWAN